ncbi:980_t:CDS:2, partial [Paraglomus brasilianum]
HKLKRDGSPVKGFWAKKIEEIKRLLEKKQLAEVNNQLSFWIKQKSRMLPKYSTFQKSLENLGLRAPILRDLLDARLIMVWKNLVTKNCTWAIALRDTVAKELRKKRDISPLQALNANPVKLKTWPNVWKPYIRAWGRVKGRILARSNWPWEEPEIMIDQWIGKQISTKRVIELLRSNKKPGTDSTEETKNHVTIPNTWEKMKMGTVHGAKAVPRAENILESHVGLVRSSGRKFGFGGRGYTTKNDRRRLFRRQHSKLRQERGSIIVTHNGHLRTLVYVRSV